MLRHLTWGYSFTRWTCNFSRSMIRANWWTRWEAMHAALPGISIGLRLCAATQIRGSLATTQTVLPGVLPHRLWTLANTQTVDPG